MFKIVFEFLIEPLGLPIPWYWEYIILAIIGLIAYTIAYEKVGNLYGAGLISGRTSGSFFHWLYRFVIFAILWALTYAFILLIKLIIVNWQTILLVIGGFTLLVVIGVISVIVWRKIKKNMVQSKNV